MEEKLTELNQRLADIAEDILIKINAQIEVLQQIKQNFQKIRQHLIEQALAEGHSQSWIDETLRRIEEGNGKDNHMV